MKTVLTAPLLTFALRLDAVISLAVGAVQVVGADSLASVLGLPQTLLFESGAFCLVYAALLWWLSRRHQLPAALVTFIAVGNMGWALGCLALATGSAVAPTALGTAWLVIQAVSVTGFGVLQFLGLQRSRVSSPVMT